MDLSQLYGISDDVTNTLRTFQNGELKSSDNANELKYQCLPITNENEQNNCIHQQVTKSSICYKSGDSRVNINPYVTTMYTIFLRSHNQIARALAHTNRSWKDEKIFRRARLINAGIYNKIIFEEWLPIVLGADVSNRINTESFLNVTKNGQVSNEFATAGIRFYYSMMPGDLEMKQDDFYGSTDTNSISKNE